MKLQIFSFAYQFLISLPIFELLHLSMDLTYRNVTPHFGNLRGRIFTHIMIEIINIIIECPLNSGSFLFCPLFLPYNQASKISPASFKDPQIRSKLLHRNVSPHFRILRPSRIRWCMSWGNEKNLVALNFALKTDSHVLLSTL